LDVTVPQVSSGALAMRHVDYRAWAQEALGETRQVYARDPRQLPSAPMVFMADGEAETLRAVTQAGNLVCPVPGCPSSLLWTRACEDRRDHFMHRQAPGGTRHDRAYRREVAQRLLADWARAQHADLDVMEDTELEGVSVSVLVRSPTGRQVAICVVYERLGRDAWHARHGALRAAGVAVAWVFGLLPTYFELPGAAKLSAHDDAVTRDRERADVVLDRPVFRELRMSGCWPLLLSIERRELANLIPPRGRVAEHLDLAPPACQEGVLHLVAHPLANCALCQYGIVTPSVGKTLLAHQDFSRRSGTSQSGALARYVPSPRPGRLDALDRARVLARLPAPGGRTTLGALLRACARPGIEIEAALVAILQQLREDGHVAFTDPLGIFSPVDVHLP
jgi:hypothetical protein